MFLQIKKAVIRLPSVAKLLYLLLLYKRSILMCDAKLVESEVDDEGIVSAPASQLFRCEVDLVRSYRPPILIVEKDAAVSILLTFTEVNDNELANGDSRWFTSFDWLNWCFEIHSCFSVELIDWLLAEGGDDCLDKKSVPLVNRFAISYTEVNTIELRVGSINQAGCV